MFFFIVGDDILFFFFFQAEDGIRDHCVTGVQTCALPISMSELWNEGEKLGKKGYCFFKSNPKEVLSSDDVINIWKDWAKKYPIRSIEDGLAENDWDGWKKLTDAMGDKVQLVGDDLFVTNPKFLKKGIDTKTANSILVKVNQIGTLSETFDAVNMAMRSGYSA